MTSRQEQYENTTSHQEQYESTVLDDGIVKEGDEEKKRRTGRHTKSNTAGRKQKAQNPDKKAQRKNRRGGKEEELDNRLDVAETIAPLGMGFNPKRQCIMPRSFLQAKLESLEAGQAPRARELEGAGRLLLLLLRRSSNTNKNNNIGSSSREG